MRLFEDNEHWTVKWSNGRVSRIQIDFRLCFDFWDPDGVATLCVETDFDIKGDGLCTLVTPGNVSTLSPILRYFNEEVDQLQIERAGRLVVNFKNGSSFQIAPHKLYEAWQLNLSSNVLLVCSPGGSVAVFQKDAQPGPEMVQ